MLYSEAYMPGVNEISRVFKQSGSSKAFKRLYDGAGGNPEIIPLDADTALLVYSDFYVPDSKGIKRKSILCRTITVRK